MALDFPNTPTPGDKHTDAGRTWEWQVPPGAWVLVADRLPGLSWENWDGEEVITPVWDNDTPTQDIDLPAMEADFDYRIYVEQLEFSTTALLTLRTDYAGQQTVVNLMTQSIATTKNVQGDVTLFEWGNSQVLKLGRAGIFAYNKTNNSPNANDRLDKDTLAWRINATGGTKGGVPDALTLRSSVGTISVGKVYFMRKFSSFILP